MDGGKKSPVPRIRFCRDRPAGRPASVVEAGNRPHETARHRTGDRAPDRRGKELPGRTGRQGADRGNVRGDHRG